MVSKICPITAEHVIINFMVWKNFIQYYQILISMMRRNLWLEFFVKFLLMGFKATLNIWAFDVHMYKLNIFTLTKLCFKLDTLHLLLFWKKKIQSLAFNINCIIRLKRSWGLTTEHPCEAFVKMQWQSFVLENNTQSYLPWISEAVAPFL